MRASNTRRRPATQSVQAKPSAGHGTLPASASKASASMNPSSAQAQSARSSTSASASSQLGLQPHEPPTANSSEASEEEIQITPYQTRVYALLRQIPAGRVSTYAALSRAMDSSPRAVGGALRRNPFAPETPCHRVIGADGYVGGFKGEWHQAPSGINTQKKLELLKGEGVLFDEKGKIKDKERLWAGFEV